MMKRFLLLLLGMMSITLVQAEKPVFEYHASAGINSNYLWRGMYLGGLNTQLDASVNYAGVFFDMWWNVGAQNWTFRNLLPELNLSLGYSRWGVSLWYTYMYYFDHYPDGTPSAFFDMKNHAPGGGGTTGEWRASYQGPSQLPLYILVCCRTFARDGYLDAQGTLQRAYSSYIQLGYTFTLPEKWALRMDVGMTPAKSLYTDYQGHFAVCMTELKLTKQWTFPHYTIQAYAELMLNPYRITVDNLIRPIAEAENQKLNMNIGCSIEI